MQGISFLFLLKNQTLNIKIVNTLGSKSEKQKTGPPEGITRFLMLVPKAGLEPARA
jgi:hypothetical protein